MEPLKFYGTVELAKELDWTKQKVHLYYKRGVIEEPNAFAGTRPLWDLEQVKRIKKIFKKGER